MPVAKSFQSFEMLTEPYIVSGKQYVKVRNPKTGTERQVRWYSNSEYNKLYPEDKVKEEKTIEVKTQKEVLGFSKGYITIFKGDTYAEIEWFRSSNARYAKWWGWYIISTEEIPQNLPKELSPIRLFWENVGKDDGTLKSDKEVQEYVESIIYEPTSSEYVGTVGERLELEITILRSLNLDNEYCHSTMHIMEDKNHNCFVWTTSSKNWPEGVVKKIRGTVKDHRTYKNTKQTVLTRCMEVK